MKVTVYLSTYNQESYVAQALDSILMQKTSFDFDIVAADDCSTDGTQAVIMDYVNRHPGRIIPYFTDPNVGGCKKLTDILDAGLFRGEYLAWLEGDDYWLGEDRLQTLVDFLESHPEYSRVAHQRDVIDEQGRYLRPDIAPELLDRCFTIEDFLCGRDYSDFGSVFRNYFLEAGDRYHPLLLSSRNVCDFQDMFITQDFGPVYLLSRSFGTYRIQTSANASNYNSITSAIQRRIDQIRICRAVEEFYQGRYDLTPCIRTNQKRMIEEALLQQSDASFEKAKAHISDPELFRVLPEVLYRLLRSKNRAAVTFLRERIGLLRICALLPSCLGCSLKHLRCRLTGKYPDPLFRGYVRK